MPPSAPILSLFATLLSTTHAFPATHTQARARVPHTSNTAAAWLAHATPTISIDAGALAGTTTSLPAATASAIKFLGVPFARSPPVRFAPAEKPVEWGSGGRAKPARRWRDGCMQQFAG